MFTLSGVLLLASWLLKTSLGRTALIHAPVRRNTMGPLVLLVVLLIWQGPAVIALVLVEPHLDGMADWQQWLIKNMVMTWGGLLASACFVLIAGLTFVRGYKGLGLGVRRIHRDLASAVAILFTIWPVVLAMIAVTMRIGQKIQGPEYKMDQHQELELLVNHPQWPLALSVIVMAVIVAPLVEELLFRGILQTLVRSYVGRPWLSVFVCAGLFASVHANPEHWPALFVLGIGLGYAYEKSGSLWQAIFVHALFNGTTVFSYLVAA